MAKWLCLCQYGHSRSVCLTRVLHGRGHAAVAIGYSTSDDAIKVLGEWADYIAILTPEALHHVPHEMRHKVFDFNVGPDRWSNPYNQELHAILENKLVNYSEQGVPICFR